jgi:hypothetical protein
VNSREIVKSRATPVVSTVVDSGRVDWRQNSCDNPHTALEFHLQIRSINTIFATHETMGEIIRG